MHGGERAQSEVIGTVLLLGLTILVVGSTVALGSVALADSQQTADLQRVEGAMTQLDSKASLVAHGESPTQVARMDIGRTADFRVDEDAGWMRIEVQTDGEGGTYTNQTTLGAVVYESGDETVAYQGGGVWRSNADGSQMVSPPEFHYRGSGGTETLTLPLVTVEDGGGPLQDSVRLSKTGRGSDRLFPSENVSNPLVGGNVTITVESEYAEAWGRFFESRTSATVTDLGDQRVQIELRTETVHPTLSTSASAVGSSEIAAGGIKRLHADSYNSTNGPYDSSSASDGAIVRTNGEFGKGKGGIGNTEEIRVRGDLLIGSNNFPPGQVDKKLNVSGEIRTGVDFVEVNPVSGAISDRINQIHNRNIDQNGNTREGFDLDGDDDTVKNDTYVNGSINIEDGSTLTVESGSALHISGELSVSDGGKVILDTTDGAVDILIEEEISVNGGSTVQAIGGNRANLHVDGRIDAGTDESANGGTPSITTTDDTRLDIYNTGVVTLGDGANLTADDDLTKNLWLYSSGTTVDISGDNERVHFTGVLYAPESDIVVKDAMTFKGSFTAQSFKFDDADLRLHYDEALRENQPFEGESVPVVSHLHVSTHGVVINSD